MYQFIYWLKTAAAILITNFHYSNIWPISSLAAGGNLGNCIFFLVSGFCLYHVRDSFVKWYGKRLLRIYPTLWLFMIINVLIGQFKINSGADTVYYLVYPTAYHFVASIMALYILYYFWRKTKLDTRTAIIATAIVYAVMYLFWFDKSSYHIDVVEESWVRFQFWTSMLLGARLKEKYDEIDSDLSAAQWICLTLLFIAYFGGKMALDRYQNLSVFQCFLPAILVLLTYTIALTAAKLEKRGFFNLKIKLNRMMQFVSTITLEIYLGQNLIISTFSELPFPLNFLIVTSLIIIYGRIMYQLNEWLRKKCRGLCKR